MSAAKIRDFPLKEVTNCMVEIALPKEQPGMMTLTKPYHLYQLFTHFQFYHKMITLFNATCRIASPLPCERPCECLLQCYERNVCESNKDAYVECIVLIGCCTSIITADNRPCREHATKLWPPNNTNVANLKSKPEKQT